MRTIGIVLAGGLSRRFGSPKAFAQTGNDFFYERSVNALKPHCEDVIVVTRPELVNRYPDTLTVMTDLSEFVGFGPLAGILSVMESVEADRYIVLPCDMPFVEGSIIKKLVESHKLDITAVVAGGKHHPLVSVWDASTKHAIRIALQNNQLSVMKCIDKINMTWIPGSVLTENETSVFTNVNTPIDIERG